MNNTGFVSLVGAGPGDPGLLTVKALRLLQHAQVIVYDRLVSDEILAEIPAGISRIAVGKAPGKHCVPQQQINNIIVSLAKAGRNIVRLKGGDPYMFGRGGEEVLALKRHGIDFEVVPGVTAASGCSAYAGIPLTHRGLSRRVQFITAHFRNDEPLDIDWKSVADPESTLVIYMGLSNLEQVCRSLMAACLPATMPAAAIENGTTANQRSLTTLLYKLPKAVQAQGFRTPVMIIIGEVVSLAGELDWFQRQLDEHSYNAEADIGQVREKHLVQV